MVQTADVVIDGVEKTFGTHTVLKDINLKIADGEFFILLGPSGCGKTTLLRILAGLVDQTAGQLYIGGKEVSALSPRARNIAMVFQDYALYPHMTIEENIGFPLRMAKVPVKERKDEVMKVAQLLRIEDYLANKPKELSGGQRQRVAIGRALVRSPSVLLMDEPLSNLDAKLRTSMRFEIRRIQRQTKLTTIFVTHDQIEAMTMGDRIAILNDGLVTQCGTPFDIFHKPENTFVATFTGSPPMNMMEGEAVRGALNASASSIVGIRPKSVSLRPVDDSVKVEARLLATDLLGNEILVHSMVEDEPFEFYADVTERDLIKDTMTVYVPKARVYLFDRSSGRVTKTGSSD